MTDHQPTEAGLVRDDLADALFGVGITLPSLRLDLAPAWVGTKMAPLVDLGRCNLETARKLAAALRAGAGNE